MHRHCWVQSTWVYTSNEASYAHTITFLTFSFSFLPFFFIKKKHLATLGVFIFSEPDFDADFYKTLTFGDISEQSGTSSQSTTFPVISFAIT